MYLYLEAINIQLINFIQFLQQEARISLSQNVPDFIILFRGFHILYNGSICEEMKFSHQITISTTKFYESYKYF